MHMVLIYLAPLLNPFLLWDSPLNEETQPSAVRSAVHTRFSIMPQGAGVCQIPPPPTSDGWCLSGFNRNHAHEGCCVHAIKCGFRRTSRTLASEPSTFSFWCGWSLSFWQMFRLSIALGLSDPACWSLVSFSVSLSSSSHLYFVGENQAPV